MESDNIFTIQDGARSDKYNLSDVTTVFHLPGDDPPGDHNDVIHQIPQISLSQGAIVLTATEATENVEVEGQDTSALLPIAAVDESENVVVDQLQSVEHQLIQIRDSTGKLLHVDVHNDQVIPIEIEDSEGVDVVLQQHAQPIDKEKELNLCVQDTDDDVFHVKGDIHQGNIHQNISHNIDDSRTTHQQLVNNSKSLIHFNHTNVLELEPVVENEEQQHISLSNHITSPLPLLQQQDQHHQNNLQSEAEDEYYTSEFQHGRTSRNEHYTRDRDSIQNDSIMIIDRPTENDKYDKGVEENSSSQQFLPYQQDQQQMLLEDFVEIYTIFKCKKCLFTCSSKDELYSHVELEHASMLRTSDSHNISLPDPIDNNCTADDTNTTSSIDTRGNPALMDDEQNVNYNLSKDRATTVILNETKDSDKQRASYFQFYLVKEQKQVFICTMCSVCMTSEQKIKAHVNAAKCVDLKCKNCNTKFSNIQDYKQHTNKCKIAIYRITDEYKPGLDENEEDIEDVTDEQDVEVTITEDSYELNNHSQKENEGDLSKINNEDVETIDGATEEETKLHKLLRNRTELEVDGDTRIWVCSVRNCYAIFKDEKILDLHRTCHQPDNPHILVCPYCSVEYTRWGDLMYHLYAQHKKDYDMYQCIHCRSYKAPSVSILEKHCQIHDNLKQFECSVCQKRFNQRSQLRNHYVMHMKKHGANIPNWAKARECDICHKVLADSKILKQHIKAVHSKLKPYICKICGYKTARNSNLRLHVRQHSGAKPFECLVCDYKTGDGSALRRHIRKHTNERPFKCDYCPFASVQSTNLKKHIFSKHKDTLIPNSTNSKIKDPAPPKKKVISINKVGLTKSSDSYPIHHTNILVDKSKSYELHDVDILGDKSKEMPSIHTLDTLLALADEN